MTQILVKKVHPSAKTPVRGTEHAAGFDLFACTAHVEGGRVIVGTGIATEFPPGYVLLICTRSGYAFKHGINLSNAPAVIDADYRGEIKLSFESARMDPLAMAQLLAEGNRVAQAILVPLPDTYWTEVEELGDTARGEGGFGSTGTK